MFDFSTVKDAASIVAPLTGAIVKTWVEPKLAQVFKGKKAQGGLDEAELSKRFEEYLTRAFEQHFYIKTLAFPNAQIPLPKLYVSLTLETQVMTFEGSGSGTRWEPKIRTVKIDSYPGELISRYERILVRDAAGMGKSTLLRFIFLHCIRQNAGIPVFVHLRQLRADKKVIDVICDELSALDKRVNTDLLYKLLERGDFVFFLDGYDEIPLEHRDAATLDLQNFINRVGKNRLILSSRSEPTLSSFDGFRDFNIKPLENNEAFGLIKKYDNLYDRHEKIGQTLIEKLKDETLVTVHEFLTNPLLVSLLYKSFAFESKVPLRLESFYRQVYDALFENHDFTKPGYFERKKYSGLDSADFHKCLRYLAFSSLKQGIVEYSTDEILKFIELTRERYPELKFSSSSFLRDLHSTVPLFICEGDYYRWSHKSFQEYFAAEFICRDSKGKQGEVLQSIVKSSRMIFYLNTLRLCKSIDFKTFKRYVVLPMLEDLMKFRKDNFNLLSDLGLDGDDLEVRIAYVVMYKINIFFTQSYQSVGDGEMWSQSAVQKEWGSSYLSLCPVGDIEMKMIGVSYSQLYLLYRCTKWNLISSMLEEQIFSNYSALLSDIFYISEREFEESPLMRELEIETLYHVDDDVNNVLNKEKCFWYVNASFERMSYPRGIPVFEAYRQLKLNIEQEIRGDEEDSMLVD